MARQRAVGAILASLSLTLTPDVASGAESVQLVFQEDPSSLLKEALVRVRAELSSIGFEVTECRATIPPAEDLACKSGVAEGRVEMREEAARIELRATSLADVAPLFQSIDPGVQQISAEVVAIRAVELLRAAMLGALRGGELSAAQTSVTARFTGIAAAESPSTVKFSPEPVPPVGMSPQASAPESESKTAKWVASVGLGPWLHFSSPAAPPAWGGELAVDLSRSLGFVGAAISFAPLATAAESIEGRTEIGALLAVLRGGLAAPCGPLFACHLGGAAGIVQYDFRTEPEATYVGTDDRHLSAYAGLDLSVARFFKSRFGVLARLTVGGAFDVPTLEQAEPLVLGRPSWGASLGLAFR